MYKTFLLMMALFGSQSIFAAQVDEAAAKAVIKEGCRVNINGGNQGSKGGKGTPDPKQQTGTKT